MSDVVCPKCSEHVPAHFAKCWKCQTELGAAGAAPVSRTTRARCSWCEGTAFTTGVVVGSAEETRLLPGPRLNVGLRFAGASGLQDLKGGGLEALRADLCTDCGTVGRLYVDEVDRLWLKRD